MPLSTYDLIAQKKCIQWNEACKQDINLKQQNLRRRGRFLLLSLQEEQTLSSYFIIEHILCVSLLIITFLKSDSSLIITDKPKYFISCKLCQKYKPAINLRIAIRNKVRNRKAIRDVYVEFRANFNIGYRQFKHSSIILRFLDFLHCPVF
jgi:hypothetical protein